jgi:hypothetical protein
VKKLSTFITEEKNLHMEHLEDLVLNDGVEGAKQIFRFLNATRDMLAGHTKARVSATVKWDGAPSIFAGIDPNDGKFFVAKKGIFNKNPKVYKTQADINLDLYDELLIKFSIALREFKKLGITKGVIQGDLMFTKGDVKVETIDDIKYYTFQPNTIVYAVPVDSSFGKRIKTASIGVVWHTTYTGDDFESMKATFAKPIVANLKKVATIWMDDATYKDVSGSATFTAAETTKFDAILAKADTVMKNLPHETLNMISSNDELLIRVKTYNNSKIRAGEKITNTTAHIAGLIRYLNDYYMKEAAKKKTEAGKAVQKAKFQGAFAPVARTPLLQLKQIFDFMNLVVDAKQMIISKMNSSATIGTFIRTRAGLSVTSPEGYVAVDHLSGGAIKLVDRLGFSQANFSSDVIKGWER